jgi:hypothetical protein
MYLHIGNNRNIREKNIIGIFDLDTSTISNITRKYLSDAQKRGEVESSTEEIPKSFILFVENGKQRICFSQLSTPALLGRSNNKEN